MTENEWATCDNPKTMLGFLADLGLASERKLRLFCCACCRHVWQPQTDERVQEAVAGIEQYADDLAREDLREHALLAASNVRQLVGQAAKWASVAVAKTGAMMVVDAAGQTAACLPDQDYDPSCWQAEWRSQSSLLREIFGPLPFREVYINSAWLNWNDRTIPRLAAAIYEERSLPGGHLDVARLAVLADALEDAGCTNADLINHCRQSGEHVRGCWVLDLLLGKS